MQVFSKFVNAEIAEPEQLFWKRYFDERVDLTKYKLPDIKRFARENGIFVSGTKSILTERLRKHFALIKTVVWCQSIARRNGTKRAIWLRGRGLIRRDLCVNNTDFYTLDPIRDIPYGDFFSYEDESGFIYGFDLKSLRLMLHNQGKLSNPYNRSSFSETVTQTIRTLLNASTDVIDAGQHAYDYLAQRRRLPVDHRIRELFTEIDRLGNYTQSTWFSDLNRERYLYFYDALKDLWEVRSGMSAAVKLSICPHFEPFQYSLGGTKAAYVYTARERLLTVADVQLICLTVIENLVYTGTTDEHKNLITAHILSILTLVSIPARNAMGWLYESALHSITT